MNHLKELREAAKLTQAALADKSGVNLRTIQNYEIDKSDLSNARAHIVLAIAKALGGEPEKLWEENKMWNDEEKEYAWDANNGQVVYRIPGKRHGDGQRDTYENPVWLLGDEDDLTQDELDSLPNVYITDD